MEAKRTFPLQDAVSRILDGSSILLFPGHESAALAFEIVHQGKKNLTIITSSYCFSADLLVRSGAVKRVLSGGLDLRSYPDETPAAIVEVPAALLQSQLSAALSGTSCVAAHVPPQAPEVFPELYREMGGAWLARAIVPDFAILHAARADFIGNVQLDPTENGLMSGDLLYAQAAKQSLISAEQIVTAEAIAMNEKQTILRAAQQPLLIEAPYGAYPCGYASRYSADEVWLTQYRQAQTDAGLLRTALPAFPASGSWYDYLQQLGFHRLMALTTNRRGE